MSEIPSKPSSISDKILQKDLQERILKKCWEHILVIPDLTQPCEDSYNALLAELPKVNAKRPEESLKMQAALLMLQLQLQMRVFIETARLGTANHGGTKQTPDIDRWLAASDGRGYLQHFTFESGDSYSNGNLLQHGMHVRTDVDAACEVLQTLTCIDKHVMARHIANFKRFADQVEASGVLDDCREFAKNCENKRSLP